MERFKLIVIVLVATILSACATGPTVTPVSVQYDPTETAWSLKKGNNSVTGMAIMRTRGGDPKTCAGSQVYALPASKYLNERLTRLYGGNHTNGWADNAYVANIQKQIGPIDPRYSEVAKTDMCNVDGEFEFKGLADGTWYILASVTWEVPTSSYASNVQGANFVKQVNLIDGSQVEVNLSQ